MSFLQGLCGCIARPSSPPRPTPAPQMMTVSDHPRRSSNTRSWTEGDDWAITRPTDHDAGYSSVVPLPRYTPRPVSIQEKTLAAHMRDPSISSSSLSSSSYPDEKSRNVYHSSNRPEDLTSDVSSAISFPSSYGNTSTATGETPPPPYSPRVSPAPSRSMSVSSMYPPVVPAQIAPPRPVLQRPDLPSRCRADQQRLSQHRRSWESR
ncbi:hypothetical protein ASPWEDRAFT_518709 [Aspergillus wentii DTO 134E9]|uniref:Uncharacterized protein n=1 Tax=Aspergillus wentii DTO 134E9 TaxID=1073089 RepID=A0A1L9RL30_ASPWE|nr:uncharacterized protein ASPWEDRAFT_518709 [Aspergillus wentii DTO 134E9]KAI9924590.1 hypothetical protein MW887_006863 [Aspergillus wentii]OJJ35646.1 hypothetical protein ASPWEDRAFT_518709 [Aspergillus wentii DTO 134E9]